MKKKRGMKVIVGRIALIALLQLALMLPAADAYCQADSYFYIDEGYGSRDGGDPNIGSSGIWGSMLVTDYENGSTQTGASWDGFGFVDNGSGFDGTWDPFGFGGVDPETGATWDGFEYGDPLPLGGGVWLLAAAAGLYLIARTRRARRHVMTAVFALTLALGTTQCRKNICDPVVDEGETIYISLNAGSGTSKADVNVENGQITWENDDRAYVYHNGQILTGTLSPQSYGETIATLGGSVTGTIDASKPFTFYYVGNGIAPTTADGSWQLSIADQTSVTHQNRPGRYMIGRTEAVEMADDGSGTYRPKENPTQARKFNPLTSVLRLDMSAVGTDGNTVMSATRVMNTMKVSLSDGTTLSYTGGAVTFKSGADARVSVMEAAANPDGDTVRLCFRNDYRYGAVGIKGGIQRGRVYVKLIDGESNPIPVTNITSEGGPSADPFHDDGGWITPTMLFTVQDPDGIFGNEDDVRVLFSPGNLQYLGKTSEWRFAEHQYDIMGRRPGSGAQEGNVDLSSLGYGSEDYNNNSSSESARDLFGWGTSNYNYGASCYQPWSTSETASSYGPASGNLSVSGKSDWGWNNISNDGELGENVWRTLSKDEWIFLLNVDDSSVGRLGNRFAKAKVNGVKGLLIFPDGYAVPAGYNSDGGTGMSAVNVKEVDYPTGTIPGDIWTSMETSGVVFLPVAGARIAENVWTTDGHYWMSTRRDDDNNKAHRLGIFSENVNPRGSESKSLGCAVRLVRDINTSGNGNAGDFNPITW